MRNPLIALFAFLIISVSASAQLYLSAGTGYAFPMAGSSSSGIGGYNGSQTLANVPGTSGTFTINQASFSSGLSGSLGIGYLINNHFAVQLNGNVGVLNNKYTLHELYSQSSGSIYPDYLTLSRHTKNLLLLIPAIVISTDAADLNAYCRFGLALPVMSQVTREEYFYPTVGSSYQPEYIKYTEKNRFSLGISAAAGLKYKLSEKVKIWAEISSLSLSQYIKEADPVSFTRNGVPVTTSQLVIHYARSGNYNGSGTSGTTQPSYLQPFSNIGISAGVCYELSKEKKSEKIYHGKKAGIPFEGN